MCAPNYTALNVDIHNHFQWHTLRQFMRNKVAEAQAQR